VQHRPYRLCLYFLLFRLYIKETVLFVKYNAIFMQHHCISLKFPLDIIFSIVTMFTAAYDDKKWIFSLPT